ncbi:hypothetical protein N9B82_03455, partial [Saprospiraceae bacterium]|nr:hypothetical protein [Saprospiraceae bacterium]
NLVSCEPQFAIQPFETEIFQFHASHLGFIPKEEIALRSSNQSLFILKLVVRVPSYFTFSTSWLLIKVRFSSQGIHPDPKIAK